MQDLNVTNSTNNVTFTKKIQMLNLLYTLNHRCSKQQCCFDYKAAKNIPHLLSSGMSWEMMLIEQSLNETQTFLAWSEISKIYCTIQLNIYPQTLASYTRYDSFFMPNSKRLTHQVTVPVEIKRTLLEHNMIADSVVDNRIEITNRFVMPVSTSTSVHLWEHFAFLVDQYRSLCGTKHET